jgi:hypothetical protein
MMFWWKKNKSQISGNSPNSSEKFATLQPPHFGSVASPLSALVEEWLRLRLEGWGCPYPIVQQWK